MLTHVSDVMRSGDEIPMVPPDASFSLLMREMSAKGLGATAIVDGNHLVVGIFTDGDLRRLVEQGIDLREKTAQEVMHRQPITVKQDALAVEAADLMESRRITSVLVSLFMATAPPKLALFCVMVQFSSVILALISTSSPPLPFVAVLPSTVHCSNCVRPVPAVAQPAP